MANINDFNIGDIVMLRSGGPQMTVSDKYPRTLYLYGNRSTTWVVRCQWFRDNESMLDEFYPETLDKII